MSKFKPGDLVTLKLTGLKGQIIGESQAEDSFFVRLSDAVNPERNVQLYGYELAKRQEERE